MEPQPEISLDGFTLAGRPNCPKCGSIHVAEIQYGMPIEIDTPAEQYGYKVLGGCCILIGPGGSCRWACRACGEEFGELGEQEWAIQAVK